MALQELTPGTISKLGRPLARADGVGEEDGRKDAVWLSFFPAAGLPDVGQESLDLCIHFDRGLPSGEMTRRHLDEPRSGDAIGDVPRDVDRHDRVLGSVHDERRHADRWQHVTDVDLPVHEGESLDGSRASTPAEIVDPLVRLLVVDELHARAHGIQRLGAWAEQSQIALRLSTVFLLGPAPGVVRRPHRAGISASEDERGGPLGVRCREEKTHRRTLR